jgi:hypothetical protein
MPRPLAGSLEDTPCPLLAAGLAAQPLRVRDDHLHNPGVAFKCGVHYTKNKYSKNSVYKTVRSGVKGYLSSKENREIDAALVMLCNPFKGLSTENFRWIEFNIFRLFSVVVFIREVFQHSLKKPNLLRAERQRRHSFTAGG